MAKNTQWKQYFDPKLKEVVPEPTPRGGIANPTVMESSNK